jgi:hypothetical protein
LRRPVQSSFLRALVLGTIACSSLAILQPSGALAVGPASGLKLKPSADHVTLERFRKEPVYLELGVYLASEGSPFELRVTRPDYSQPIQIQRIVEHPGDVDEVIDLPSDILDSWVGLRDFMTLEIQDSEGDVVSSSTLPFCPNNYERQRIGDAGPEQPTYPDSCYSNPFTRGMVWGIDADWAVGALAYDAGAVFLKNGEYTATMSISDEYVNLFGIDPNSASATVDITVVKIDYGCYKCGRASAKAHHHEKPSTVPTVDTPNPAFLPDLLGLPAWGISVDHRPNKTFLNFGATVWNGGASSMVVEGFRRSDEDVMDAYQYFHENGQVVGKAQVGTMEYDKRSGHQHWHFLQFARYSLLDSTQTEIVRSRKEAFCLAPTDAIDLTVPDAELTPYSIGLGSACGSTTSLWTREVLPLGWGDTYTQARPGQSFNITNLPNGTYYIAVTANPTQSLFEQTYDNNTELREITIKGKADNRKVIVPPWNGIDTESGYGGGKG